MSIATGRSNAANANMVGPVLRAGELADVIVEAIRRDNPDNEVHVADKRAYLRVSVYGECIVRRSTVEELLRRPFLMQEIEPILASFAGQIEATERYVRFFLDGRI
ncbi:MmoB/DmpM family protein [Zavarzinia compransoris]|uniref:Monooxygenase n=1 Tax=Zavarzinia compransoris TaxID=1264899 RepID=A0A317DXZ0_9PROT|nr:MmoB/DmpM family protein [Zavarzinia compransoris]PWR17853.1 monooxygenase [Zavarzinia compransoris]TDP49389.1 toluene monooxygenase system protein D [Zavarzinia compransoris]